MVSIWIHWIHDPDAEPAHLLPSSSCLGTNRLSSCEHIWAKTAAYVETERKGNRERMCETESNLSSRSQGL